MGRKRRNLLLCLWITAVVAAEVRADDFLWNNFAGGSWNQVLNWNGGVGIPDDASDTARITINNGGTPYTIILASSITIGSLDMTSSDARLTFAPSQIFTVSLDSNNNGQIRINDTDASGANQADLRIGGNLSLLGAGSVLFTTNNQNRITTTAAANLLTIGTGQTIATDGAGTRGQIMTAFDNLGIVEANGGILTLDTNAKTNHNIIRARNNGTLNVSSISVANTAALIAVETGSIANLSAATIVGGTINGGGNVNVSTPDAIFDGSGLGLVIDNVTVNLGASDQLTLVGLLNNFATLNLSDASASGADQANLRISGDVTLGGTGSVQFTTNNQNRIISAAAANVLTIGAGQVVGTTGTATSGQILAKFTNNGIVEANGGTLTFDTNSKINSNLIRAKNSGTLNINNITLTNTAATLNVEAGSTLNLNGTTLIGGTINGGGNINIGSSNAVFDGSGAGMILGGTVSVSVGASAQLILTTALTNNALIKLNDASSSGADQADLRINGDVALGGTGSVLFTTNNQNRIISSVATDVLTIGADQLISTNGAGTNGQILAPLFSTITKVNY